MNPLPEPSAILLTGRLNLCLKGAFVSFEREVNGSRIGVMTIREDGRYELRCRKEYNFDWYIDNVELHYTVNGEVYHTMTKLNELFNNRDLVLTAATTE